MKNFKIFLDLLTVEIKYSYGHLYWDRGGQTVLDIETQCGGWFSARDVKNVGRLENPEKSMNLVFNDSAFNFSTEINGVAMAAAGVNDSNAAEVNVKYLSAKFSDFDTHPGSFENTSPLSVKLFASPCDGSILGGEVWGGKSAGEMINTISLAIQKGVTVYEFISFQIGTHPLLTSAPTKTILIKAAEGIIAQINK